MSRTHGGGPSRGPDGKYIPNKRQHSCLGCGAPTLCTYFCPECYNEVEEERREELIKTYKKEGVL